MRYRIANEYHLIQNGNEYLAVALDQTHMIRLNNVGYVLWGLFQSVCTETVAIKKIEAHYNITERNAKEVVEQFVVAMKNKGVLAEAE